MAKTRVLFEAGPMVESKKTGIGYYVEYLIKSIADTGKVDLEGYYFNFIGRNKLIPPRLANSRFRRIRFIPGKLLSLTRRFGWQPPLELLVRSSAEIVLFTNYVSLPVSDKKKKVALVVYDLSFIDHPNYTEERNLAYLESFAKTSIYRADLIITISEFTRDRLRSLFPAITCPIVVTPIPPALSQAKDPINPSEDLSKFSLSKKQYILYLGTIEPRKNIERLILAYARLPKNISDKYPLVLAGGKGWRDEKILQTIKHHVQAGYNIKTTGYISEREKATLYKNAWCFVMPSIYEGFGMPILEAMQFSTPTAVSDIPVFREVAGDATLYFNPNDPVDISKALERLISDKKLHVQLSTAQKQILKKYSWSKNADLVVDAFTGMSANGAE